MNISQLIETLQKLKDKYGDLPVCHYNNMSYHRKLICASSLKMEQLKRHIDKGYSEHIFCDANTQWFSAQKKFDKQECEIVLTIK